MRRGGSSATGLVSALVVTYTTYFRGLIEGDLEILLDFLGRELFLVVWLEQQAVGLYSQPITLPLAQILLDEGVGLTEVDELKVHKAVILLVENSQTLDVCGPAHFAFEALVLGTEQLLADFEAAELWVFV